MENAYSKTEPGTAEAVGADPVLAWKVHLLREEPAKVLLVVPAVVLSLLISYAISRSLLLPAVTLFLLTSAFSEYLFPIRYEIGPQGASAKSLFSRNQIAWDRVKKCYLDDDGVKLSPLARPSRLEAYRGVYLRFGDRRDEVIQAVRMMKDGIRGGAER